MGNRTFLLPEHGGYILFTEAVLHHMYQHTQRRFFHREAGGQLFSETPHEFSIVVSAATGPNPGDVRTRHGFVPHSGQATLDRNVQFEHGRHPIGLWHTHPEITPTPSLRDYETVKKYLAEFSGAMTGFLLITLGNRGNRPNMAVWLAQAIGRSTWMELLEV